MNNVTFLFAEPENLVGLIESLKEENLENARVFIDPKMMDEISGSADKVTETKGIKEITWTGKDKPMGFIDYETNEYKLGIKIKRINLGDGKNLFLENTSQLTSKVIVVQ